MLKNHKKYDYDHTIIHINRIPSRLSLVDKITLETLKSHLWKAADILRGSLDAQEYRQPVMTILFLKRLNDTFEENVENLVKEGQSQKKAEQKFRHKFFVPKTARWNVLSDAHSNLGEIIDNVCRDIEKEVLILEGVLTNTKYNDKKKYPDDKLHKLIAHFNGLSLKNKNLEVALSALESWIYNVVVNGTKLHRYPEGTSETVGSCLLANTGE